MSNTVPEPPQASFAAKKPERVALPLRKSAPLDGEFLNRVYRFTPRFGIVLTLCLAILSKSVALPLSFAAGLLTGLLVLKTQEMFVRRVVRPKYLGPYDGTDKKFPAWLIVPGKYAIVIATLWLMRRTELLHYAGFAAGCTVTQLIVLTMAMGRLSANRTGGRKQSLHEIYVAPYKVKKTPHA